MLVAVFMGIKEASAQVNVHQDTASKNNEVVSFGVAEKLPEPPGGGSAFNKYLHKNIKKPIGVQGRLIITFVVEQDGSLTEIKVLRGLSKEADEEAIRVLKLSPKWKPSIQNGKVLRSAYTMPITF
ncbi:MAG: hypothetical protein EOP41_03790 [Sphingobacteriaceae bacterium]|nr:MAG: hypothetical protein EOP41_03790 [Sphingobacteriaceae bacterium]